MDFPRGLEFNVGVVPTLITECTFKCDGVPPTQRELDIGKEIKFAHILGHTPDDAEVDWGYWDEEEAA